MRISANAWCKRASLPMAARLKRGEVLLTARILPVPLQLFLAVMPRHFAPGEKSPELEAVELRELAGLAERQCIASVERHRELFEQLAELLPVREAQGVLNRIRDLQNQAHSGSPPASGRRSLDRG